MISHNYFVFTEAKYNQRKNASETVRPRKANKNVAGIANSGFLAFLCNLLLLVLLQSKNFPAFNPR
jgi:hypothetical protein